MTVVGIASAQSKKLMKFSLSLFRRGFNPSKCKTAAKMAMARIKLLRNKRQVVVKQMRRDIAMLLQSGQDATARIRVEHVIREQNILAANEIIELFCELIVTRLTIITKQRECPADLKEGIASVIFAAPRCSEIPELADLRDTFEKKYGRDFVSAATDLRPSCGVNRMLVDKLSVRNSSGEFKLKIMKEIAKEFQVDWDTTESEQELLKPPEEVIEGPRTFVSASSFPVRPADHEPLDRNTPMPRSNSCNGGVTTHFQDTESAAEAAAESAMKAVAAAQAAAFLANRDVKQFSEPSSIGNTTNPKNPHYMDHHPHSGHSASRAQSQDSEISSGKRSVEDRRRACRRRSSYNAGSGIKFDESDNEEDTGTTEEEAAEKKADTFRVKRHSNNSAARTEINFDESDYEEETEPEENRSAVARFSSLPPTRPPPQAPPPPPPSEARRDSGGHHVHPKLPDYDMLAARFEALKRRKSHG
ncbi:PREDICTED: uncharacterized protein LOC104804285 [Tarenaya hassleriana]|uniref:uncharacterized protein LOC104804285 n=1 Tax=Tarenaya hassleriana TaxID=28532 RepID=UPI00053C6434|nr:PREDICTED: uncharacterized protein LOC104804285 [Tarenaya hassleriana]